MIEFKRKERDYRIEMKLLGSDYVVNVSPTSHVLLKQVQTLQDEARAMLKSLDSATVETIVDIVEAVLAKEKAVVDLLLPGAWEGFYDELKGDVLDLTELVAFVVAKVLQGASTAKLAAVAPVEGNGEEV